MKRFTALILCLMVALCLVPVASTAENTYYDIDDVDHYSSYVDNFYWDGMKIENSLGGSGRSAIIDYMANPWKYEADEPETCGFLGWVCFKEPITVFGYLLNGELVTSEDFAWPDNSGLAEVVEGWWAGSGELVREYFVEVPISGLQGKNEIVVVAVLESGKIVKLNSQQNNGVGDTTFILDLQEQVPVEPGDVYDVDEVGNYATNLDSFYWNGERLNFNGSELNARETIDEYMDNKSLYDVDTRESCGYLGWACFYEPIVSFGYLLNGELYTSEYFFLPRDTGLEQIVEGWWPGSGELIRSFLVTVPIKNLTGTNEIVVVAVLESGDVVKLNSETYPIRDTTTVFEFSSGGQSNALIGDVDGDGEVSDWDAVTFERYLAGWAVDVTIGAMDTDGDGEVSDWDAIVLARYLAGWYDSLPLASGEISGGSVNFI
ncbi:MAG: dockerin type I repeat-containing protein [Clostridia bacterium]|nr:dockerin type I repeat-containing protein [Clostridia bacterium]